MSGPMGHEVPMWSDRKELPDRDKQISWWEAGRSGDGGRVPWC